MLKLLWRHWDHVTRPVLLFRAALEINGQGLFKTTKCADTAATRGHVCAHDADYTLCLGFLHGFCFTTTRGLMYVGSMVCLILYALTWFILLTQHLFEACLTAPQPQVPLGQKNFVSHGLTSHMDILLTFSCRSSKSIRLEETEWPFSCPRICRLGHSRTSVVLKALLCCLGSWGQCLVGEGKPSAILEIMQWPESDVL